jgi:hypothetical protein
LTTIKEIFSPIVGKTQMLRLYVRWLARNMEEREEVVSFDHSATVRELCVHALDNVLKVRACPEECVMKWGNTFMNTWFDEKVDVFFNTNNDTFTIICPASAEWIPYDDVKRSDAFKLVTSPDTFWEKNLVKNEDIHCVRGLLTDDECESFIAQSELLGYAPINYDPNYRSNTRVIVFSEELASGLFARLTLCKSIQTEFDGWRMCKVNPQFRFCKYTPNQLFAKHLDGCFVESESEKSFYTINIYLNEDFDEGATRFYLTDDPIVIQPKTGMAVIFNHQTKSYLHDGQAVSEGCKYLLRTDLMFTKE